MSSTTPTAVIGVSPAHGTPRVPEHRGSALGARRMAAPPHRLAWSGAHERPATPRTEPATDPLSRGWEPGALVAGRYEVIGSAGLGGMARVYRAYDRRLERTVALKIALTATLDAPRSERLVREAKIAGSLCHPAIVRVFDLEYLPDGTPFVVLEYLDGEPLHAWLEEGPLAYADVVRVARPLVDALAIAHRAGIVHRDVKPSNVLVTNDGRVVLLDFGLGLELAEQTPRLTPDGSVVGTPAFLAPEVLLGGEATPASDVYALGVSLVQLLTGQIPFRGALPEAIASILHTPAPRVDELADVPRALGDLVVRMLAKQPTQRFESALELRPAFLAATRDVAYASGPPPRRR